MTSLGSSPSKLRRTDQPPIAVPESERRITALTVLLDVALQLGPEHDLGQILQIVTTGISQAAMCERATLFLVDERHQELYTHVATELEIREIRMGLDEGICGWAAQHRAVAHVSDPQHDDRWNSTVDMRTGFVTRNILAAPVISNMDDRLVGVLQVLNKSDTDFDEFDRQLIQAFAAHAATALERRRMQENLLRTEEFKHALEMGRRIQRGFLPDKLPDVPGYDVASWWHPATFVSGDYYDWMPLSDGRTCFVMGDVSGHGLGPSLIMASLRAMLHVLAKTIAEPARVIELLAESIAPDLKQSQFVSFLVVSLNPVTHSIRFANAGHAPALHYHLGTDSFTRLEATQVPLGFPPIAVDNVVTEFSMEQGDMLVLGTDGVIEVRNPEGVLFGVKRLQEIVRGCCTRAPSEIVAAIRDAVLDFHGQHPPDDDSTLVIVKRSGCDR